MHAKLLSLVIIVTFCMTTALYVMYGHWAYSCVRRTLQLLKRFSLCAHDQIILAFKKYRIVNFLWYWHGWSHDHHDSPSQFVSNFSRRKTMGNINLHIKQSIYNFFDVGNVNSDNDEGIYYTVHGKQIIVYRPGHVETSFWVPFFVGREDDQGRMCNYRSLKMSSGT